MTDLEAHQRLDAAALRQLLAGLTAVRRGDFSVHLEPTGDPLLDEIMTVFNGMADQLHLVSGEVTRVAREVGTEGKLGGQAYVPGISGRWRDLTESFNAMADNLTTQVRNIAQVTTAVASGDLTRKIDVEARGEILELKTTVNTMVDQLSSFAAEVTRVAREVGREGLLGGQAEVKGVAGTWQQLTENVNELAENLTRQVRSISEVTSAVAAGDLTRSISVGARGEVAALRDNINAMVQSLRESVLASQEQDWLKTNLARFGGMLQGHRNLEVVADLIMTELAPLVGAQHGTFFIAEESGGETRLRLLAGYGLRADMNAPVQYRIGQSLIGQVAKSKRPIVVDDVPPGYIKISSGLGEAPPANLAVLPVVFEDRVLGVVELASFTTYSQVQADFLEQVTENLGITVNALIASSRTDALLAQAQRLTAELQASNEELANSARQLAEQKRSIEAKNTEIELARAESEERARQLALASAYKSQFLANMSHELRTPLNSLLILARLLTQNPGGNLTPKQVDYANVIHSAGSDLLQLIDDILDLSKVEAGRMDVHPERFTLRALMEDLRATFGPLAAEKGLDLTVEISPGTTAELVTDRQRLRQVIGNLMSNAVKFTERGSVTLRADTDEPDKRRVAFSVADTGVGIAPDKLAAIFGAFQQGDDTLARRYGGTGLGLSIAREVAALLGGEVTVDSDLGRGSTFTLRLPAVLSGTGAGDQGATAGTAGTAGAPGGLARNVLVFEQSGQGLCTLLAHSALARPDGSRSAAAVHTATTPEQGIALLAENPFQCLVVDFGVPSASGFLDQVRQRPDLAGLPVLAHAARDQAAARARVAKLRSDGLSVELVPSLDGLRERITSYVLSDAPAVSAGEDGPPAVVVARAPAPAGSQGTPRGGHATLRGRKVLVVDDDERTVIAIASTLELHGVTVTKACDGQAGIDALLAAPDTDLVLLDLMMPGMDGYAALTVLRQMPDFGDLPVIAVTARAMPGDRDKSLQAGASDYVTKPIDTEELLARMERWLAPR